MIRKLSLSQTFDTQVLFPVDVFVIGKRLGKFIVYHSVNAVVFPKPLFKHNVEAGGGNSALQEAILLSDKCSKVIMLQDMPYFTGEQRLQDVLFARANVEAHTGVKIEKLLTENGEFSGVEIKNSNGQVQQIKADGLFVAIGLVPENEPFKDLASLNEYGYFASDESCTTKTPGVFVAGDCRSKFIRQITTAAADGTIAALAACNYINSAG